MTKEEPEIIKQGYQPIHSKNAGVIPPNTGSHVRMKENEYTWKDLDKAWWEGFDNAKNKMEKRIADLEKENAELKTKVTALENANRAMVKELDDMTSGGVSVLKNIVRSKEQLTKAKELLKWALHSDPEHDEDFEKKWSEAEQFLKEISK